MAPYLELMTKVLRLSESFLEEHDRVIREKLRGAAADLRRESSDIFAINQCLHLASSIVLRNTTNLNETLDTIRRLDGLPHGKDPATILTIATLYFLLERESKRPADEDTTARLGRIRGRFQEMNWMIGPEAMAALGIPR